MSLEPAGRKEMGQQISICCLLKGVGGFYILGDDSLHSQSWTLQRPWGLLGLSQLWSKGLLTEDPLLTPKFSGNFQTASGKTSSKISSKSVLKVGWFVKLR